MMGKARKRVRCLSMMGKAHKTHNVADSSYKRLWLLWDSWATSQTVF